MTLRIAPSPRLMHAPPAELGFKDKALQYIEESVAHWLLERGALPLMVATLSKDAAATERLVSPEAYAAALDGLVLQGGADLSPESYGEAPADPAWRGDPTRDAFELALTRAFIAAGKPVFGICRGAQLINVALGGTLWQDLPTMRPSDVVHRDAPRYDDLSHDVHLRPGSRLARLYGDRAVGRVTSIHHQAVRVLGRDLEVEAEGPDGLIEAIRWTGPGFVAGVQWHPEFHGHQPELLDGGPLADDFLRAAMQARASG